MKPFRNGRKIVVASMIILLAGLLVGSVMAGAWAVVTLDELPGKVHAGETVHLSFMVRQHGKTPIHYFQNDPEYPLEPVISGQNVKTGETIEFAALPDMSEVGRFIAEVVFPTEGEWAWRIVPKPMIGTNELVPLIVLPSLKVPATSLESTTSSMATEAIAPAAPAINIPGFNLILRGAASLLLAAGIVMAFMAGRHKEPRAAVLDPGS
jgi:hypothetical protein